MKIERLPLFPLNTVLMPQMVLPLHIFEPRYRLMLDRVLTGERRFGVLLARGTLASDEAAPYEVGTVAEVTEVVPLESGRLNISTTGCTRFRVTRFHHDQPYLTGDIETLPDLYTASERLLALKAEVECLSLEYITTVLALSDEQVACVRLPADPVILSYKVAGLLVAIQPFEAQELLASNSLDRRFSKEIVLLRRELAILRHMGAMPAPDGRSSPN